MFSACGEKLLLVAILELGIFMFYIAWNWDTCITRTTALTSIVEILLLLFPAFSLTGFGDAGGLGNHGQFSTRGKL